MSETRHDALVDETDPAAGIEVRTSAVRYPNGYVIAPHRHDWHQLIYASEGVMTVATSRGSWVVPSRRAVWVAAGVEHSIQTAGSVAMRTLYLAPHLPVELPHECCAVNVSPLLRELILHIVELEMLNRALPRHQRLIGVLLDQIETLLTAPLQLPMPSDARALRVVQLLRLNSADDRALPELARETGTSARTVERAFRAETGMSFGRWRRQLRLQHALTLLAAGESVTNAGLAAGYSSTSAFVAMFKQALGVTPGQYYRSPES